MKKIIILVLALFILAAGIFLISCDGGTSDDNGGTNNGNEEVNHAENCAKGIHSYTVENKCAHCTKKWEYTEGLNFRINEGGNSCSVLYTENLDATEIVIPYGYNGIPVTEIFSQTFILNTQITSVVIPDSVTKIGNHAFWKCTSLTSVTVGNGVTEIRGSAFDDCTALTSVTLGNSVQKIGYRAFGNCSQLTSLTLPKSITEIGSSAFEGCVGLADVNYLGDIASWCEISFEAADANPMHYAEKFYIKGTALTGELVIPEGVKSIGAFAFDSFYGITSVTLYEGLESVGACAFFGCVDIENVYFIGDAAAWSAISFATDDASPRYYAAKLYINGILIE